MTSEKSENTSFTFVARKAARYEDEVLHNVRISVSLVKIKMSNR